MPVLLNIEVLVYIRCFAYNLACFRNYSVAQRTNGRCLMRAGGLVDVLRPKIAVNGEDRSIRRRQ